MKVLGLLCSPHESRRVRAGVRTLLGGAEEAGAAISFLESSSGELHSDLLLSMEAAQAVVCGSPTYRADISWPLKVLLDSLPRGHGGEPSPLQGKVCATVMSGGSSHHFLASDKVRSVLGTFFGAQLLSPAIYLAPESFSGDEPSEETRDVLHSAGAALVDLASAVAGSQALQALRPPV